MFSIIVSQQESGPSEPVGEPTRRTPLSTPRVSVHQLLSFTEYESTIEQGGITTLEFKSELLNFSSDVLVTT